MKPLLLGFLYVASLGLLGLRLAHDTVIVLEIYWAVRDHLPRIGTVVSSESKILSTSFVLASVTAPRLRVVDRSTPPYLYPFNITRMALAFSCADIPSLGHQVVLDQYPGPSRPHQSHN
ncbi:hypothetical protein C8F04DRAFT_1234112 [Mycena alexandri]|uniref:Secreted protein n=1 Tax=Mycena alexandri TaxID=1745969 RepID=A0AAD6SVD6_9AGAR|nr:hypothetical protein C8F04DRAFT_1234112 [Mycena alexandri]